tara:strand:+ start:189 stop:362 length:174 start_codon:yes stop_codon:yes gene_type:complete
MSEFKKVVDKRFHGGEASVKIDGDSVQVFSSAGFQVLKMSDFPDDLLKKIQTEDADE